MDLVTLPLEILTQILTLLPPPSLLACTRVSCHLHRTIAQSIELQYTLAKHKAGVIDAPTRSCISTAEKRALLDDRERAWQNFDYKFLIRVDLEGHTSGLYDVTPTAYFLGCAVPENHRITRALQHLRLPRVGGEMASWEKIDVGRFIIDFGTSVEENDLLALVCYRQMNPGRRGGMDILLRRFSDGQEHTLAQKHTISICDLFAERGPPSISIEISGENLTLCVDYVHAMEMCATLYIYNWKTGSLKFKPTTISNLGLVFLRHDIFIQPDTNNLVLDAYYIPPSDSPLCGENKFIRPFASLSLPEIKDDMEVLTTSCRGDPSPRDPSSPSLPPLASDASDSESINEPQRPFTNRAEDALIIFTLDVRVSNGDDFMEVAFESFSFLLHRDSLLDVVEPFLAPFLEKLRLGKGEEEEDEINMPRMKEMPGAWGEEELEEHVATGLNVEEEEFEDADAGLNVDEDEDDNDYDEYEHVYGIANDESEEEEGGAFFGIPNFLPDDPSQFALPQRNRVPPTPWSKWGPPITRWFAYGTEMSMFITTTSGGRYVHLSPPSPGAQKREVEVIDFGRGRVREAIQSDISGEAQGGKADVEVVSEPSTIEMGERSPFKEAVVSYLPYVRTVSKEAFPYEAVLVDEERIIGMKGEQDTQSFDVLYFG